MYRTRFRDQRSILPTRLEVWQYQRFPTCSDSLTWRFNGGATDWNLPFGRYVSMRDVSIPAYHKRVAKGEVFFNPCVRAEVEITAGGGYGGEVTSQTTSCSSPYTYTGKSEYRVVSGSLGLLTSGFSFSLLTDGHLSVPGTILNPSDVSALRTEVSTACLSSVGKSDSNLYESLAEADKLLGMLPQIFGNGLKIVNSYGFQNKAKGAASAYLAVRYGLLPVIREVESVMQGLKRISGRVRRTYRSQGSISGTKVDVDNAYSWAGMFTCKRQFTHSENYTIRAMSLNEYYASVMSNIGFTTKGLLTLPWELVPYSFVVDWFVNVGDVLGALAPDANMTQLGSCLVEKRELTTNYTIDSLSCSSGYTISKNVSGNCARFVKTYSRSPGPLVTGLVVKSDFRFSNLTRSLDALGLIIQKLR